MQEQEEKLKSPSDIYKYLEEFHAGWSGFPEINGEIIVPIYMVMDLYHKQIEKKLEQMEEEITQAINDANTHGM